MLFFVWWWSSSSGADDGKISISDLTKPSEPSRFPLLNGTTVIWDSRKQKPTINGALYSCYRNLDLAINQQLYRAEMEVVASEEVVRKSWVNQSCKPVYFINRNQL
ncbi:unnamed protein product [Brassica oleracea var. botrytis]|uniref:(rape) hypothetical protein n=1 Tax=Brassica napus TaxID=3708 RepID=A0A816QC60_BRANA|nr:unnamed protein product [Brassica napus]